MQQGGWAQLQQQLCTVWLVNDPKDQKIDNHGDYVDINS